MSKKHLFVIRSISGGGKTTLARKIISSTGGVCLSGDDFFYKLGDGDYRAGFDLKRVGEAHQDCMSNLIDALDAGLNIAMHNVSTYYYQIKNYVKLARREGYEVTVISIDPENDAQVQACIDRSAHNVPAEFTLSIWERWEHIPEGFRDGVNYQTMRPVFD